MSDRLTAAQREAATLRGVSISLSAGAGCGKTTVLTRRYLGLLEGPEPFRLDEIAALTFTEKAARELRQRVRKACRDRIETADDPGPWLDALRDLESATIQTFHGFCGEILRRFPLEAGVEPEFAVLDEAIGPTLRREVLDACLRDWLAAGRPELIDLAVEIGLETLRDALARMLMGLHRERLRGWSEESPEGILEHWKYLWESDVRGSLVDEFCRTTRDLLPFLADHECSHPKMRERIAFLSETLPTLVAQADPAPILDALVEQARVQGGGTAKNWDSPETYERVKREFEALRDAAKKLSRRLVFDEPLSLEAARLGRDLAALAADALGAYDRAKAERGCLDFDDLILKAGRLLREGPAGAREAVRTTCRAILVDEFQDTDPSQGEILRSIAGDDLTTGRLFLVGDFKQSIYRFRGAEPKVFDEFRTLFPPAGQLALNANFRSVAGIIDFVNALFGSTFPGPVHELRSGHESLAQNDEPCVEFLWANEPTPGAKPPSVSQRRRTEARWLARYLAGRIRRGWTLTSPGDGSTRAATAGDIVFLFRTLNDVAPYEQALAAEGLDYHVVGGSAYFGQQEVLDLINVLSVIEDPFDEICLAATLRSPFFCVSDEGLYWLSRDRGGIAGGFARVGGVAGINARDRPRVERARDLLAAWREAKDRGSMAGLVDRVLEESGYEAALLGEFLGDRKRANVRKFGRLARRFDAQGGLSLADFVARLRADFRDPPREGEAATAGEGGDAVRLLTIHQAKGLEFPIVVIPDLNRDAPRNRSRLLFHPVVGPLVKPSDDPASTAETSGEGADDGDDRRVLGWTLFDQIETSAEREEALRLFYVAATRAKNALILSAGMGAEEKPVSPALKLLAERFERATGLFVGSAIADHPDRGWSAIADPTKIPKILVTTEAPPEGLPRDRRRLPLRQVARVIEEAGDGEASMTHRLMPRESLLDLDPGIGLSPLSGRVDGLLRAILLDPKAFDLSSLADVAQRAGRAVEPEATSSVISQAFARWRDWLETPLGRVAGRAEVIRRGLTWAVAWPRGNADAVVYRGAIDLAFRDSKGGWHLINFADAQVPRAKESLRLVLSGHLAPDLGLGPVSEAWSIRFGPGGGLLGEEGFSEADVDRAILLEQAARLGEWDVNGG